MATESGKSLSDCPLVFLSGKGGVGKTTMASAFALKCADAGERTLLVSTDPAHNLGDAFGQDLSGGHAVHLTDRLDAIEIDPDAETDRYIRQVKANIRGSVRSTLIEEAERQIDMAARAPGAYEAAVFDRMVAILLDESEPYDRIVFDTAPTGHTLRLLTLPELMGAWVDGLLRKRQEHNRNRSQWMGEDEVPDDPIHDLLHDRRHRIGRVREQLLDRNRTAFVFVLIPEALPIAETERAVTELREHHLRVDGLIVNQVLPEDPASEFLTRRGERQKGYLEQIDAKFADLPRTRVPLQADDVVHLAALRNIGQWLVKGVSR